MKMDLIAVRLNTQLAIFVSCRLDSLVKETDAFSFSWLKNLLYAFPPFCLVSRCLAKLVKDKEELVLIEPTWHTQMGYARLLEMAVSEPVVLTMMHTLLRSLTGQGHPWWWRTHCIWWHGISVGRPVRQCAFRMGSQNCAGVKTTGVKTTTCKTYNHPWQECVGWCELWQEDPIQGPRGVCSQRPRKEVSGRAWIPHFQCVLVSHLGKAQFGPRAAG